MVEKDWMRLARIRSPEDDEVGLLNLFIGAGAAPCAENRRQTGDAGRVSSAVTAINVVAADDQARKLLRHEIRLVSGFRATEQSECPWSMSIYRGSETCGSTS
jgi:hypothetical protein